MLIIKRLLIHLGIVISAALLVISIPIQLGTTQLQTDSEFGVLAAIPSSVLPAPKPHPLPITLAQWQDSKNYGDYFSQITPTAVGYLIWSQFPVKVYIQPTSAISNPKQAQNWVKTVWQAVQEWKVYLPLELVEQPEIADITIKSQNPPLKISPLNQSSRARAAETRYEFYASNGSTIKRILSHRCTILLSPSLTSQYLQASARHELGHALGIWGHSLVVTDALYFSSVRHPQPISPRDINTLKRVYTQPTRLGWELNSE